MFDMNTADKLSVCTVGTSSGHSGQVGIGGQDGGVVYTCAGQVG